MLGLKRRYEARPRKTFRRQASKNFMKAALEVIKAGFKKRYEGKNVTEAVLKKRQAS